MPASCHPGAADQGIPGLAWVAYGDGVGRLRDTLGIRLRDVGATLAVAVVVELNVTTGDGAGAHPLNFLAYVLGAILPLPVLLRRKYPLQVLIACTVLLFVYYSDGFRRNISPAPLLSLPLYDAALAGFLAVSIIIPAIYLVIGMFVVETTTREGLVTLASDFLPQFVVLALAIMLGEVVRSRRALTAETANRLRLAAEERESEAARRVAEERLRHRPGPRTGPAGAGCAERDQGNQQERAGRHAADPPSASCAATPRTWRPSRPGQPGWTGSMRWPTRSGRRERRCASPSRVSRGICPAAPTMRPTASCRSH
ncbi:MAG: hypothetical protein ABJB47_12950 [Actinomycetota bacterium]